MKNADMWGHFGNGEIVEVENTNLCGDPMEVVAVGIPYVRVRMIGSNVNHVLDTRQVKLMELPKEFAK